MDRDDEERVAALLAAVGAGVDKAAQDLAELGRALHAAAETLRRADAGYRLAELREQERRSAERQAQHQNAEGLWRAFTR
jgi:hypothetical protein